MLTSLLIAAIIGSPIAGILLEFRILGFEGWQCLFLIEAVPALVFTFVFLFWVKDRPDKVSYLTPLEKEYLNTTIAAEEAAKESVKKYTIWQSLTDKHLFHLDHWFLGFPFLDAPGTERCIRLVPVPCRLCHYLPHGRSPHRTGSGW